MSGSRVSGSRKPWLRAGDPCYKAGRRGVASKGYLVRPLFDAMKLRPFQREFVAGVLKPGITRAAACRLPRGNGKSCLAGYLAADALTPGGSLFESGAENILLSGSFDQARYCFRFARQFLGESGYSFLDSTNKLAIRHKATGTRLLVRSSRARGAFGIVGARLAIADEPGALGHHRRRDDGRRA